MNWDDERSVEGIVHVIGLCFLEKGYEFILYRPEMISGNWNKIVNTELMGIYRARLMNHQDLNQEHF
jgi:hypothetical protein